MTTTSADYHGTIIYDKADAVIRRCMPGFQVSLKGKFRQAVPAEARDRKLDQVRTIVKECPK